MNDENLGGLTMVTEEPPQGQTYGGFLPLGEKDVNSAERDNEISENPGEQPKKDNN